MEALDNVVTSLNGRENWVDGVIRFVTLKMGEWIGFCEMIVIHFRDYKMIIGINFLMQAEVSIMP